MIVQLWMDFAFKLWDLILNFFPLVNPDVQAKVYSSYDAIYSVFAAVNWIIPVNTVLLFAGLVVQVEFSILFFRILLLVLGLTVNRPKILGLF